MQDLDPMVALFFLPLMEQILSFEMKKTACHHKKRTPPRKKCRRKYHQACWLALIGHPVDLGTLDNDSNNANNANDNNNNLI